MFWIRLASGLIIVGVVAVVAGFAGLYLRWAELTDTERTIAQADQSAVLVERGRYLAAAGDCVACHTADGGVEMAGGRPFDTPFGRLFSTNITPDPDTGIGSYTAGMLDAAMRVGAASFWRPLYPAMPYTSFHFVERDDNDAIYAWLMSRPPVGQENRPNEMPFPFDIRLSLHAWNAIFTDSGRFVADPTSDPAIDRGRYLVTALGHCGECHTPRNALGAMEVDRAFEGAIGGGAEAPALTPASLKQLGWDFNGMSQFLATGTGPSGTAFGDMFLVIKHSLSELRPTDIAAMSAYLLGLPAVPATLSGPAPAAARPRAAVAADGQGARLYRGLCAGCHGTDGTGIPGTMPSLAGNTTLAQPGGYNLVRVIAEGIPAQRLSDDAAYGAMPGFRNELDNAEIAALADYTRRTFIPWSGDLAPLAASDVAAILGR